MTTLTVILVVYAALSACVSILWAVGGLRTNPTPE